MSDQVSTPFATFPKVKGAVAYDVYMSRGGFTHLDVYYPVTDKPVHVGTFDADGNPVSEVRA